MEFPYFTQCILLSFANALSNIFSRDIFFLTKNLGSWKPIWQLKLRFRATEFSEKLKFDIYQKVLFCTLASSSNLVLNIVEIAAGKHRWKCFTFFTKSWSTLNFPCIFREERGKTETFSNSWKKYLETLKRFSAILHQK